MPELSRREDSLVVRWVQHVDIAVLIIAAVAGIFFGLADVIFDIPGLQRRQLGIAIALLGVIALHAIIQRLTAYRMQGTLDYARGKIDDLVSLDKVRKNFVRAMGNFIEVQDLKFQLRSKNEAFGKVADRLLAPSFRILEGLTAGMVSVPENLVVPAFTMMLDSYTKRFDAVSNDDIDFWHDNKTIAPRYLSRNIEALRRKVVVTRLFIVPQRQILDEGERRRLASVMSHQRMVGIAWALAIYEDLEPNLPPGPLDFALFDHERATSTFRREGERRFIATFNTDGLFPLNDERIAEQCSLYEALPSEVWLASEQFANSFRGKNDELVARLRMETDLYNHRLEDAVNKKAEHAIFPFIVGKNQDIGQRLADLARIYDEYQDFQAQNRP